MPVIKVSGSCWTVLLHGIAHSTDSATEILNTSEVCLRIEVQYLGNAARYGVGVNRWPIGNQPIFMLYRLARSPLTQSDWKVKDRFVLVRSANSAQAQSLLLCPALYYSALSWEAPWKSWGGRGSTVKKISCASRRNLCRPLLKCFRRHCMRTWPLFPGAIPDVQIWTSYVKAFEKYSLTDSETDRHDRSYIPRRFVGGQQLTW